MMYDVFICHASEDKEGFVRSLVVQLQGQHVAVWNDDFSLQLGDSIRHNYLTCADDVENQVASPSPPSWNQIMVWLRDMAELRELGFAVA